MKILHSGVARAAIDDRFELLRENEFNWIALQLYVAFIQDTPTPPMRERYRLEGSTLSPNPRSIVIRKRDLPKHTFSPTLAPGYANWP